MSTATRRIINVGLKPTAGSRFQPTGFPDIEAAVFERPLERGGWESALIVESSQSMANHLEAQGWDDGEQEPMAALAGLPYVRVVTPDSEFLTSSRLESHRLASAYIKDATGPGDRRMTQYIAEEFNLRRGGRLSPGELAKYVMKLDPLAVLHGVFFAEKEDLWPGQPRLARALSGFVEAIDVKPVVYGGVRRDDVWQSLPERPPESKAGTQGGYKNVVFHRTEFTAREITASFILDVDLLQSYRLGDEAVDLLAAIAEWEIQRLFDGGFRPRTACDLKLKEPAISYEGGDPLPSIDDLEKRIQQGVEACAELLGDGEPLEVVWSQDAARNTRTE